MKGIETLGGRNSASSLVVLQHKKKRAISECFLKENRLHPILTKEEWDVHLTNWEA